MARKVDTWTETCNHCGYSADFTKYSCGCITRQNTDKWKEPSSSCETFTDEENCGHSDSDKYYHKTLPEYK